MENYFIYNDPIRIVWRKGDSSEPYVDKVESQKVINNMVVLTEIPDEFTHVSISGYTEIYEGTPSANQFIVNYENGLITFHPSKEGITMINMTYKGRGFILYPASRIYGHNDNPDVVVTLQQIIDAGDIALEALSELVVVIANAEAATATAVTQAAYAKTQGDYAKAQGDYSKLAGDSLTFKGTYAAGTSYVARNMVYYNGATYMAIVSTTGNLPTNATYWKKIGSMVWRGIYAVGTTYTYGDFVVGASGYTMYMSISETNTGQVLTNTSYWTPMINLQSVVDLANTATTNANTATANANTARDNAITATANANTATSTANTATTNANTARDNANTQATYAKNQGDYAKTQGDYSKTQGESLIHKGDYSSSVIYVPNNMVYYNGCTYICILITAAGTLPTNTTFWRKVVAFNWKGTFNLSATYQYGDFVIDSTGQRMYLCIKDITSGIPLSNVTNWTPIIDISSIVSAAVTATTNANAATTAANTAKTNADTATAAANVATTNANTATTNANAARDAANTAKTNADIAANYANTQGDYAKDQGDYAKAKGDATNTAISNASSATTAANNAASAANTAKYNADIATSAANVATTSANTAASGANTAKTDTEAATIAAITATTNTNDAITAANSLVTRTVAKGAYSSSTTYYPNNIVSYNGSSYICTVQALNKVPTDSGFWQLLALKGNDGTGSVTTLTSSNSDLIIAGTVQVPDLAISTSLKALWSDKYTKTEVDSLINQITYGNQWKPSVANFEAIATTYPNPQDGWTVNVNDTDYTYRYTGSSWIAISANSIPNASDSVDGKMSSNMYTKLNGITSGATRTLNSATNGNITVNGVESIVYSHPTGAGNNHIPSGGATDNFLKYSSNGTAVWVTPTLAGLAETSISSPTTAQVLRYNGTSWVNASLTFADIGNGTSTGALVPNLNADMLDGKHASDFMLAADGRMTGAIKRTYNPSSAVNKFMNVQAMNLTASGTTGTLKITLPVTWNSTMMNIKIVGYDYNRGNAWELILGGYNYIDGGIWLATNAISTGTPPFTSIRFGHDGTKCCILLGTVATLWNIQSIEISSVTTTWIGYNAAFESGWNMGIVTSETGITVSSIPVLNAGTNVDTVDGFHLNQNVTTSGSPIFNYLTLNGGPASLVLKSNVEDHAYMTFYARASAPTARSGYFGYGGAGTKNLQLSNEESGGDIILSTSGKINIFANVQAPLFISTIATGTAPFSVVSSSLVANLNANYLMGYGASTGANALTHAQRDSNADLTARRFISTMTTGTAPLQISSTTLVTNLNSDLLDGFQTSTVDVVNTVAVRDTNGNIVAKQFSSTVTQGGKPFYIVSTTMNDNLNADMVDGFHLDQDVRTNARPTFNGINSTNNHAFISKMNGFKSWNIHHPDNNAFVIAPSWSVDDIDWDWGNSFTFREDGEFDAYTLRARAEDGVSPMSIDSKTLVENLNADMLDGKHASYSGAESIVVRNEFGNIFNVVNTTIESYSGNIGNGNVWTRVAETEIGIGRNNGRVEIRFNSNTSSGTVCFEAGIEYGVNPVINQIFSSTTGAATVGVKRVRIVYNTTAEGNYAYLDVLKSGPSSSSNFYIKFIGHQGWKPYTALLPGFATIPTGYTYLEHILIDGMSSSSIVSGSSLKSTIATGTAPLVVASSTMVANLNANYVGGYGIAFDSSINTIAMRNGSGNISAVQLVSTATQGNAPLVVASSTIVPNLNASLIGGYAIDLYLPTANTIPVRNSTGKIKEIASNRVVTAEQNVPTSSQIVTTYTTKSEGLHTIKIYLSVTNVSANVDISIEYRDFVGLKKTTVASGAYYVDNYYFVPVLIRANYGTAINVYANASVADTAYISTIITEE